MSRADRRARRIAAARPSPTFAASCEDRTARPLRWNTAAAADPRGPVEACDSRKQLADQPIKLCAHAQLKYPPEIRKAIYTTNAIEALNRQLRKVLKTKGALPSDEAASKLLFLALRNAKKTWGGRTREWTPAFAQFTVFFGARLPN